MSQRENRLKVQEAAKGNIKLPLNKSGKPKKIAEAKKQKLIANLTKIKNVANELSDQLNEIDETLKKG